MELCHGAIEFGEIPVLTIEAGCGSSGSGTLAAGCSCRDARESVEELEEPCQPNRIKNAIAGPAIEVEVPLPARVVRGSFRRTSQKPTNAATPTASASEQDRASLSSVRQVRRVSSGNNSSRRPR